MMRLRALWSRWCLRRFTGSKLVNEEDQNKILVKGMYSLIHHVTMQACCTVQSSSMDCLGSRNLEGTHYIPMRIASRNCPVITPRALTAEKGRYSFQTVLLHPQAYKFPATPPARPTRTYIAAVSRHDPHHGDLVKRPAQQRRRTRGASMHGVSEYGKKHTVGLQAGAVRCSIFDYFVR